MNPRVIVCLTSMAIAFLASACIELTTTNEGGNAGSGGEWSGAGGVGGAGNTGSGSASSGGMGAGSSSVSSGSSSSTSSSSGAASMCDEPNASCSVCESCEGQTMGGACSTEYTKCRDNANCALVDDCVHMCPSGDFACLNDCWSMLNSMGNSIYGDYYVCMYCGACLKNCAMTIPCD